MPFNFIQNDDVLVNIGQSKFRPIRDFIKERYKADIRFDDEAAVFKWLSRTVNKNNGGRGMLNAMEQHLINPLSDFVFEEKEKLERGGRTIRVSPVPLKDGSWVLDFDLV